MISEFDYNRFRFEDLTKQKAEEIGHIAWIESRDSVEAIRKMLKAVEDPSINTAVWPTATAHISPDMHQAIHDWRQASDLEIYSKTHPNGAYSPDEDIPTLLDLGFKSYEKAIKSLKQDFETALQRPVTKESQTIEGYLYSHLKARLKDIFKAADIQAIGYQLRQDRAYDKGVHAAHCDGQEVAGKRRLLEYFGAEPTWLFANTDTEIRTVTNEELDFMAQELGLGYADPVKEDMAERNWRLKADGPVTFYRPPPTSMILITQPGHKEQPIMHTGPYTSRADGGREYRTVAAYDFCVG